MDGDDIQRHPWAAHLDDGDSKEGRFAGRGRNERGSGDEVQPAHVQPAEKLVRQLGGAAAWWLDLPMPVAVLERRQCGCVRVRWRGRGVVARMSWCCCLLALPQLPAIVALVMIPRPLGVVAFLKLPRYLVVLAPPLAKLATSFPGPWYSPRPSIGCQKSVS